MKTKLLILTILLFAGAHFSTSQTYYWIGGTGNWSDTLHWSTTSGGTFVNVLPGPTDDVIFDDNSGLLTTNDTVYMDLAVSILDFDASAISTGFTFSSSEPTMTLGGSLLVNGLIDINWTGAFLFSNTTPEVITSSGTLWQNNFSLGGSSTITLTDGLTTIGDLILDQGSFISGGNAVTINDFISNSVLNRTLNISNSIVTVNGTSWIAGSTNFNCLSTASEIDLTTTATFTFDGGMATYDTLVSNASQLLMPLNCSFTSMELATSSDLLIGNGTTVNTDILLASGICGTPLNITTVTAGASGFITFTGAPQVLQNLFVDNVNTSGATLILSDTTSATGWNLAGSTFYWIGNSGSWNDGNHWSFSSGGTASGCVPKKEDNVIFDGSSFSISNATVTVTSASEFTDMDWTGVAGPQTLLLNNNLYAYGDVTLYPNLTVKAGFPNRRFEFKGSSLFNGQGASVATNISVNTVTNGDQVMLTGFLNMPDSTNIFLAKGILNTAGQDVETGSIITNIIDTVNDQRSLIFGSSNIHLNVGFYALNEGANFTFDAGTSHVYIADTADGSYANYLRTEGLTFYDVTFDVDASGSDQRISGSNSYHRLVITAGSTLFLDSLSNQSVTDSLLMIGTCVDSIYLSSSSTSLSASISVGNPAKNIAHCIAAQGLSATTPLTFYFSEDFGGNSSINFSTTAAADANFTIDGPYCYGDTTFFTNNSVAFSGNFADITSYWYFNDGSTGYFQPTGTGDSVFVNYEIDTNQHVFLSSGDIPIMLVTMYTNACKDTLRDTIHINNPIYQFSTSQTDETICFGETVSFEANALNAGIEFEFFLNGTSLNTPSVTDTLYTTSSLADADTVGLLAYENGCTADSMSTFIFTVNPLPVFNWLSSDADTSICAGDLVSFFANDADSTNTYRFMKNFTGVTSFLSPVGNYSTSTLVNNDTMSVIAKTGAGCTDTLSMVFHVDPLPGTTLASSVAASVICTGDPVTFTAGGAATYEFFIDGQSLGAPSASNSISIDTLESNEVVTVMGYLATGCGKVAPTSFSYVVNPLPNVQLAISDADTSICSGQSVTFNASGASIYEFFINGVSQGAASPTSTLNSGALADGDAIYVNGNFSGCSQNSDTVTFEVLTAPVTTLVSDDADQIICSGTTVNFTAGGAGTYEFFLDGVSQGAASATNTFAISYLSDNQIVSVNGYLNGCPVGQSLQFSVLNTPSINLFSDEADNAICEGESITFTAANGSQYELFVNNVSQGPAQASPTFTPTLPTGSDTVYVIGTAANGCSASNPTPIITTVTALPTVTISSSDADNIICAGTPVTISGSGSSMYQFFIDGMPQGVLSATSSFSTSNLSNGQVVSAIGSTNGCTNTSNTINFTVNAVPTVTLSGSDVDNIFCIDNLVTYTAGGATNYQFFVNGVSQGAPSGVNTLNSSSFAAGSYSVSVVGESNSCSSTASTSITVNPLPNATIASNDADNTICSGESIGFTAGGGTQYQFLINGNPQGVYSPLSTFNGTTLTSGDAISVNAQSASGCINTSSSIIVTVNPTPTITLVSDDADQQICVGQAVQFTAGGGADNYSFFVNGALQSGPSSNPVFSTSSLSNGDQITVSGSTLLGCSADGPGLSFNVFTYPVVSLANNVSNEMCNGDLTDVSATGADNYLFYINGNPQGSFAPGGNFGSTLNDGDQVTVEGETNGCISSAPQTITYTVYNYPLIAVLSSDADNIICIHDTIDFTSSGAMTYDFILNGTVLQTGAGNLFSTFVLEDGDQVQVIGYNGTCASIPHNFNFTVNSMDLQMTAAPSSLVCAGDNVTFNGSGADQYAFLVNGATVSPMSATSSYSSASLNDLDEVTMVGFDATTGCTQALTGSIYLNELPTPMITAGSSTTFCEGDSVVLISNAGYGNQWFLNGSAIPGATDTMLTVYDSGDYSLEVTAGGNGNIWSFGLNANGTFGNGENFNSALPLEATATANFEAISAGDDFVLAVDNSGNIYAWGENSSGQLGLGTYTNHNLPQQVPVITDAKTVATGAMSSMAVTNSGDVYVWGNNTLGQLATGNTSVINFPFENTTLAGTDTIAAGKNHFVILKNDGTVWTVGGNAYGQLGHGNLTGLMTATQVSGLSNVQTVGAGEYHSFAIDAGGDLYVWGNNGSGQLGLGDLNNRLTPTLSGLKHITQAQGGANHSVFLATNSTVYTAGGNSFGQLGNGTTAASVDPIIVDVQGTEMISAGRYTTLLLRYDHSTFGFGNNVEGELSTGGTLITTPTMITGLDGVTFIEAGRSTSHVIYGESTSCVSTTMSTQMLPSPDVSITISNDTLSTISGTSYQWYLNGNPVTTGGNSQQLVTQTPGTYTVEVTFASGCTGLSGLVYYLTTGKEELEELAFTIYPNPVTNALNIRQDGAGNAYRCQVIDQTGRLVLDQEGSGLEHQLATDALEYGVYLLRIVQGDREMHFRFMKVSQ